MVLITTYMVMASNLFCQSTGTTLKSSLFKTELTTFLLLTNHKSAFPVFSLSVALSPTQATQARNLGVLLMSLFHFPHSPYPLSPSSTFSTLWISLVFAPSLQLYHPCSSSSLIIFHLGYCNKTLNFASAELQLPPTHCTTASITNTNWTLLFPCNYGINSEFLRIPFKFCLVLASVVQPHQLHFLPHPLSSKRTDIICNSSKQIMFWVVFPPSVPFCLMRIPGVPSFTLFIHKTLILGETALWVITSSKKPALIPEPGLGMSLSSPCIHFS